MQDATTETIKLMEIENRFTYERQRYIPTWMMTQASSSRQTSEKLPNDNSRLTSWIKQLTTKPYKKDIKIKGVAIFVFSSE